jgi:dihydrodipicolinate synthase/N-acetylneuraminate lyase
MISTNRQRRPHATTAAIAATAIHGWIPSTPSSAATDRPVMLYNVPHRTGSNVSNETVLQIAETCANLLAVKDSCGDLAQSTDLIRQAPTSLAVLTGEDARLLSTADAGGARFILTFPLK